MKLIKNNNIILKNYKLKDLIIMLKNSKKYNIKSREIKDIGKYPVISQEQKFISGYSDDSSLVYGHNLPVILFGDHTTIIKYVNFPFIIGADGTQVFHTVDFVNLKFLYYYMKNIINLKIKGYSRHFKDLKEKNVNLISLIEQKKISYFLSKKEQHIDNIKSLISKLEKRNEYYADKLLSGEILLENYDKKSFNEYRIKDIIKEKGKSKLQVSHAVSGEYPFYNCSEKLTLSHNDYLLTGDSILLSTGGKAFIHFEKNKFSYSSDVYVFDSENMNTEYLYFVLKNNISLINSCFQGSGLKHLNKKLFIKIKLNLPSVDYQLKIVSYLNFLNKEKEKLDKLLEKETKQFEWLSEKLLSGEYIIEN